MGLEQKLLQSVAGPLAENHIMPRVDAAVSRIYDNTIADKRIACEIRECILEKHGQEVFYCDLDRYITNNNLIESLINTVRGKSNVLPSNQVEFASTNTHRFINENKNYNSKGILQSQINDIFAWMFDFAFSKVNSISPHTDIGKLQNEMKRVDSASEYRDEKTYQLLEKLQKDITSYRAEIVGSSMTRADEQNLENCPPEFDEFTSNIKSIESKYQWNNQFEIAISKYYELLQVISGLITGQSKKYADTLICTLNCNIALCQANLAEFDKAYRSLDSISKAIAEDSKTYHFVYAAVSIQHSDSTKYLDAQTHLNRALHIDPLYHRAFLLRQYLCAIMKSEDCFTNIQALNAHFAQVLGENSDLKLISDFYMNRGMIYLTYDEPYSASEDFCRAIELGGDELIAKLNLAASLYAQAVISLPKGERFFHPKIDFTKIVAVLTQLKPIVASSNIDTVQYKLIAEKAIGLYVSACTLIGVQHDLSPLTKYLGLTRNYETQRALILGSQEELSDTILSILNTSDRAFVDCRAMLKNNRFDECRRTLEILFRSSPEHESAPLFHILLQILIITKDTKSYWKYRASTAPIGVDGDVMDAMDACALELDGEIEQAKALFDGIASNSDDYQLLENTLRFYKRNMFNSDCVALYFHIQERYERKAIFIEDLDEFYGGAINFLVSINSQRSVELLDRINLQKLSLSIYRRLQVTVYSKTNDVGNLLTCIEQIYAESKIFQDGFNLALCQKMLMRYDLALETCHELLKESIVDEKLVNLYWLISDLYLFKKNLGKSYDWARKAHQLTIQNPYNTSHQALFGRALRCGNQEGFTDILEYKNIHPVVLNWIQPFSIDDNENPVESLTKQLEKFSPHVASYNDQEKDIASKYKMQKISNHLLLELYHNDLCQFFRFAEKNKLRITMGDRSQLKAEEDSINSHIVVDSHTLIILSYYECLPALQSIEHIHINYGTLNTLQAYYMSADYPYIGNLLKWMEMAENIVFHQDGFIEDSLITKTLSRDFAASCAIARDNQIPLLYSDALAPACAIIPEQSTFKNIKFVSIPSLCNHYGRKHQKTKEQMLYRLVNGCTFISFSANTIIAHILENNYNISTESINPFLICKSDYDMQSFADVYLQTIHILYKNKKEVAVRLAEIIIDNAFVVWRRGTYYRMMAQKHGVDEAKTRAQAIARYVFQIATQIVLEIHGLPVELADKCNELEKKVVKSIILFDL